MTQEKKLAQDSCVTSVNLYRVTVSIQSDYTDNQGECEVKIPDSTWYRPGDKRVEDIPGYALCSQCRHCTMTRPYQIVDDGKWYCFRKKDWFRGDDILTYNCKYFRMKNCHYCVNKYRCHVEGKETRVAWCNRYREQRYRHPSRYFVGRPTNSLKRLKDTIAIGMEEEFREEKKLALEKMADAGEELCTAEWWEENAFDNKADGSTEKGESEEVQGRTPRL